MGQVLAVQELLCLHDQAAKREKKSSVRAKSAAQESTQRNKPGSR